ncbi:MAG TPA: zinc-dependent alcohol dehydrogenase family protein [Tepidisphaeraceae bacterium]|jgi:propanol-preferring alcohol dehydrogenase|nr:zinc-dependent alcohol dehydrogenase family protein [Tepidisphaeraceae bacterium]
MQLEAIAPIENSPLRARDIAIPAPAAIEVLVRVLACGICRTDLHIIEGELPPHRMPMVPGHQVVGVVEQCGSAAKRFKKGDRVGIAWLRYTCGKCRYCLAGNENLCPNARFTGYDANGGYAQYAVVREDFGYALPPEMDPVKLAPLLCAGIIGFRALRRANVTPGCRLGLYGFGSSASIAIQVARHWKCTTCVMTRDAKHQALARELGATWVGGATDAPPDRLDSAVLFAPAGDLVLPALEALDMGGTLALAGIYLSDIPKLSYQTHLFHEKNLRSVTANTREDGEGLLALAAEIPLLPQTTTFPLVDANLALQQLKHDGISGSGVLLVDY